MKNTLILTSNHQFDVVSAIARQIAEGILQNGHQVTIVNTSTTEGHNLLSEVISTRIDLVIAMNPNVLLLNIHGVILHKFLNSKFAIFFLDNPIYTKDTWMFLMRNGLPDDSLLMCIDAEQTNQLRLKCNHLFGNKYTFIHLPWAANDKSQGYLKKSEKNTDLVIFSTLDQQLSLNFIKNDSSDYAFSKTVCERAGVSHHHFSNILLDLVKGNYYIDVINLVSNELGVCSSLFSSEVDELCTEIDSYLKRYRRFSIALEIIKIATKENLNVSIYGTGWDRLGAISSNIRIHGPVNYDDQFNILKSSKVILNTDPNWVGGVHDRVFNAFSVGCVALTNANFYADLNFMNGHDCVLYKSTDELSNRLSIAMTNYEYICNNAYKSFILSHTYKSRFSFIFNYLDYLG